MEELGGLSSQRNDLVKLFVGQIPKDMDEETLSQYFEEFGPISEITVIRDSITMSHKGCAFVTYQYPESAQAAVEQLHDKVKLLNSPNPLQVRIAETQTERENKLFIGMLPKTINEEELHNMFIPYGDMREVHIIRAPDGSPKGCAFVKFVLRESAAAAILDMHDTIPTGATRPLVVKFADSKKQGKTKGEFDPSEYGGGPNTMAMNSPNWYNPQANAPQAIPVRVPMSYPQINVPTYYNSEPSPRVPAYMQSNVYYQQQQQQQQAPNFSNAPNARLPNRQTPMQQQPQMMDNDFNGNDDSHSRPPEGPSGANLFIYHLPRDLTDADLATLFAPFGNVISAKVFVDKKTSDSKGFGFVSYDTLDSANAAIESMNGFQIGSKRLKVQHKRVAGTDGYFSNSNSSNNSIPLMSTNNSMNMSRMSIPSNIPQSLLGGRMNDGLISQGGSVNGLLQQQSSTLGGGPYNIINHRHLPQQQQPMDYVGSNGRSMMSNPSYLDNNHNVQSMVNSDLLHQQYSNSSYSPQQYLARRP
eukprot:gene10644-14296_t